MKKPFSFLIVGLLLSLSLACENDVIIDHFPTLDRTYVHPIPGCDNSGNQEENCVEWLGFIGNSRADLLYGGGDIVQTRSYRVDGTQITVYDETGLSSLSDLVFKFINHDTLQRIDDNSYWVLRSNP